MLPWYYVWSPRYEIFHRTLSQQLYDISGIKVKPLFVEQSVFTRKRNTLKEGEHFFTGIGIKIYAIIKILKEVPGNFIVFSDVDLVVLNTDMPFIMEPYKVNDITCMRDSFSKEEYNIGCMLIKSTPETISLFERTLELIHRENLLDQLAFNKEIANFKGTHAYFSTKQFLQSNMIHEEEDESQYRVIQCLCAADQEPMEVITEKIITLADFVNITSIKDIIQRDIYHALKDYAKRINPSSYIASWN
jgi:hypothetical protein